jgi:hypothetical protein
MLRKAPKHKHQITNKLQTRNTNDRNGEGGIVLNIGDWIIGACLEFEIWCLML